MLHIHELDSDLPNFLLCLGSENDGIWDDLCGAQSDMVSACRCANHGDSVSAAWEALNRPRAAGEKKLAVVDETSNLLVCEPRSLGKSIVGYSSKNP